jgi:hypothetical protein
MGLLQRNQNWDQLLTFAQRSKRLANDRPESLTSVRPFHSVPGVRRGCQKITDLNRRITGVHFAIDLAEQSDWLPVRL